MRRFRHFACIFLWATLAPVMAFGTVIERDTTAVVSAPDVSMVPGGTAVLCIQMENDDEGKYDGYQFDILLPQGVAIAKNDSDFIYSLSQRYDENATVIIKDYGDGSYRVMVFSISDATISGTEGELISLTLQVDSTQELGMYHGTISNFKLSSRIGVTFMGSDAAFDIKIGETFLMGDVNHDGNVDISDVMMTVNSFLGKKMQGFFIQDADTNGDGEIDIVDAMNIVNILVKNH